MIKFHKYIALAGWYCVYLIGCVFLLGIVNIIAGIFWLLEIRRKK